VQGLQTTLVVAGWEVLARAFGAEMAEVPVGASLLANGVCRELWCWVQGRPHPSPLPEGEGAVRSGLPVRHPPPLPSFADRARVIFVGWVEPCRPRRGALRRSRSYAAHPHHSHVGARPAREIAGRARSVPGRPGVGADLVRDWIRRPRQAPRWHEQPPTNKKAASPKREAALLTTSTDPAATYRQARQSLTASTPSPGPDGWPPTAWPPPRAWRRPG